MRLLQRILSSGSVKTQLEEGGASSPMRIPLASIEAPPPIESAPSFGSDCGSDDGQSSPWAEMVAKRQRVSSHMGMRFSPLSAGPGKGARPPPIHTVFSLEPGLAEDCDVSAVPTPPEDGPAPRLVVRISSFGSRPGSAPPPLSRLGGTASRFHAPSMSLVAPNLYVGDEASASASRLLEEGVVTHVLNCTNHPNTELEAEGSTLGYLRLDLVDSIADLPRMKSALRTGVDFIKSAIAEGGVVLVHCHRGISRSATLAMAYLVEVEQRPAEAVFETLRAKRAVVDPNLGFWVAIQAWEKAVLPPHLVRSKSSRSLASPSPRPLSRAG